MLLVDGFALFLDVVILLAAGLTVLLALNYLPRSGLQRGEFYYLLLFTVSGMMLMAQAGDLLMVFLALELLSIPLYILSGFARPKPASEESALKYFLLGAFASAFLVYGIALVYGATGTTNLAAILAANVSSQTQMSIRSSASASPSRCCSRSCRRRRTSSRASSTRPRRSTTSATRTSSTSSTSAR